MSGVKREKRVSGAMLSLLLAALVYFSGCKHQPELLVIDDNGGGGGTDTTWVNPDPCDPDSVYFVNTILPLLSSSCAKEGCHDAITHEEGVRMYDYQNIMEEVEAGNPFDSKLVEVITDTDPDKMMPPPSEGGPLSQEQIDLIITWIAQGANNNQCTADCDPGMAITYSGVILPIVENACQGCHSGSNPSGNLTLTSYAQIAGIANSGALMHSLLGTNGYSVMPQNTTGLPQCMIDQFQVWVDDGAPEN